MTETSIFASKIPQQGITTSPSFIEHRDYLEAQKRFWTVDEDKARLERVDTDSKSLVEYEVRADADFARITSDVVIAPGAHVIEIGCGVGRLLSRFLAQYELGALTGLDISGGMIEQAERNLGQRPNLKLVVNSGADLTAIPEGSADFIYAKDVFIHIHDVAVVRSYLREIRRVLKPSGVFRFNVRRMDLWTMFSHSPGGWLARLSYMAGINSPIRQRTGELKAGFDGIQYRERDLRQLATAAHLKMSTVVYLGHIWCTCRPEA
jgi:ubiquinone/menaquinone biosynthesis C-methylase UbiE